MRIGELAGSVGKGLAAGLAGTAAMTISSTAEMKARGRQPSTAPADAAGKVLGVSPVGEREQQRFGTAVHWAYGTSWGAARGLIGALGLRGGPAAIAHFGTVWGTALVMLPRIGVAPPVSQWGPREVAIDAWHHAVYAATASLTYDAIDA